MAGSVEEWVGNILDKRNYEDFVGTKDLGGTRKLKADVARTERKRRGMRDEGEGRKGKGPGDVSDFLCDADLEEAQQGIPGGFEAEK